MRRNVDLPQPDGPISAVTVPGGIDSDTRSSTLFVPNQAETWSASRCAPVALTGYAAVSPASMTGVATVVTISPSVTMPSQKLAQRPPTPLRTPSRQQESATMSHAALATALLRVMPPALPP